MGERESPAVDALFADLIRAGENRPQVQTILAQPIDEQVLAAVLRRAVPAAALEAIASLRPWSERPRVLARVVLNPRASRALALRLVPGLYWRDLAEVAATARLAGAVRARAESQLRDGLADMRLGDRVTLARLATPPVLNALLADGEARIAESALQNPRLREEDLVTALKRDDVPPVLLRAAAESPRWSVNYAVRLALVLQRRTPLAVALAQISSLVPRDLRRAAGDPSVRPLLRAACEAVLDGAEAR
jgi:hypothetical protein